jgi:hypothetical protein
LVAYPQLSVSQQKVLPKLIRATAMPQMFDDSTHQLWDCETKQGPLILKVCNKKSVLKSTFWLGMKSLFNVDLPVRLGEFETIYRMLSQMSPLTIPDYIASGATTKDTPAFIACKKIPGTTVHSDNVSDEMVIQLAEHLAQLHQQSQMKWGRLTQTEFDASQWSTRLQATLKLLAKEQGQVPKKQLD